MKKYLVIIAIVFMGLAVFGGVFLFNRQKDRVTSPVTAKELDKELIIDIVSGQTFSQLMAESGLGADLVVSIINASKDVYDLSSIRAGRQLKFYFDKNTDQFKK